MRIHFFTRLILALFFLLFGFANLGFGLQKNSPLIIEENDSSSSFDKDKQRAIEFSRSWNRDSIKKAFEIYLKLSHYYENQRDKKNSSLMLRKASDLCIILGEVSKAIPLLEKSLEFERDIKNVNGEAETLILLSYFNSIIGNFADCNFYLISSMNLFDKVDDLIIQAAINYYAGEIYFSREDIPKFIKFFTQALNLYRKAGDKRGEARTLFALSYASIANDNLSEGLRFANESFSLWKTLGEKRGEVLALSQIGFSQFRLGQTTDALENLRQAELMFPPDVDKTERAILSYNIGRIYESFSDCRQGIHYYKNSLNLLMEEKNLSYLVGNLWSLGALTNRCGDKEQSLSYLYQCLKLAKKLDKKADIIYTYIELGEIYASDGKYKQSKTNFQTALQMLQKTPYKMNNAKAFDGLGNLYEKLGEVNLARENYVSALSFYRSIRDDFAVADTLYNLSRLDNSENQTTFSIETIKESIKITEHLYSGVFNSNLKSTYFSSAFDRYELYINLLMKLHKQSLNENYAIQALQAAEKSRARLMLENLALSEADFTKDADIETLKREKEIRVLLNTKADKLTDLLSRNADKAETEKVSGEINELENELEEIKATLKQSSPIYSAIKNPAPFDVAEFQRNVLDENSLLLEFSFGKEESYLWLVNQTEVNSYVLPPREQIEAHVEKLRESLASREMKQDENIENYQARISEAENIYKSESQQLSDELFGQIAGKLLNKRLIIIPDGKLHYFPIAALPLPHSTDNLPILLTNETVYEPSAATLALLMRNSEKISTAPKNLLIFSDPIFSDQDARISAVAETTNQSATDSLHKETFRFAESLTSLGRLNASQDEADAIIGIIGASESTALSGAAATRERALDASVSDYKIIHFATHGLINEQRPELSGIVLSQVDQNGQNRNGVVRLQDIYAMNLSADAVILSACNTGIGKEVKGEGLLSLNNAFLQAGAKSVVSSLWKVDDYAAQELMKNFYQELSSGTVTTSEALRRAQIKMQHNPRYKSPFYWAAFKLEGDFQTAPNLARPINYWIYALLIFPLLLLGMYFYRRKSKLLNRKIVING